MKDWRRQGRRLRRAAHLTWHVIVGLFIAHVGFYFLAVTGVDRDAGTQRALVRWWTRGVCRVLNVRLVVDGRINTKPTLFTANHISWLDIPCLRTLIDATFVAKDEVRRWPMIGDMAQQSGTIFLNRGDRDATTQAAELMTWLLTQRQSIIIFPEGTTSNGCGVRRFHARLYQAALRTRADVQAIAITYPCLPSGEYHAEGQINEVNPIVPFIGDDNLARHLWTLLAEDTVTVKVNFCVPIHATGLNRRALADITRSQVLEVLDIKPAEVGRAAGHD